MKKLIQGVRAYQGIDLNTPVSGLPVSNGIHKSSVALDGANSIFQSKESLIGIANEWSIGIWANAHVVQDSTPFVIKPINSDAYRIEIEFTGELIEFGGTTYVRLYDSNGTKQKEWTWIPIGHLTTGWHYYLITWDGTDIKFYINGAPGFIQYQKPVDNNLVMADIERRIEVGSLSIVGTDGVDGWISELQIWNTVLNQDEIIDVFNYGMPGWIDLTKDFNDYSSSTNLKHWYRFGYDCNKVGRDFTITTDRLDIDDSNNNVDEGEIRCFSPAGACVKIDKIESEYFATSVVSDLGFGNDWSISTWFRVDADKSDVETLLDIKDASTNNNRIHLYYDASSNFVIDLYSSEGVSATWQFNNSNPDWFKLETWNNLIVTHTDNIVVIYINGIARIPDSVGTSPIMTNTNRNVFFGIDSSLTNYITAYVYGLAMWNIALSASEIVSIYNNGIFSKDLTNDYDSYESSDNLKQLWYFCGKAKSTETGSDIAARKAGTIDLTAADHELNAIDLVVTAYGHSNGSVFTITDTNLEYYELENDIAKMGIGDCFTISGWCNIPVITGDNKPVILLRDNGSFKNNRIRVRFNAEDAGDPVEIVLDNSSGTNILTKGVVHSIDGVGFKAGEWRHWVITWNGYTQTIKVYINGIEGDDAPLHGSSFTGGHQTDSLIREVHIGHSTALPDPFGDVYLVGQICQYCIWNKDLNTNEIKQIYALGYTFNPNININAYRSAQNLIHWYPFMDISDGNNSFSDDMRNYKSLKQDLIGTHGSGGSDPDIATKGKYIGFGPSVKEHV